MKVLELIKIKDRGVVALFDQEIDLSKIKINKSAIKQIDNNQEWIIIGIEKWAHCPTTTVLLLKGDQSISIGDQFIIMDGLNA